MQAILLLAAANFVLFALGEIRPLSAIIIGVILLISMYFVRK